MKLGILRRLFSSEKSHQSLLFMLFFVMVTGPLVESFDNVQWLMPLIFVTVLVTAVRTMAQNRVHLRIAVMLAAVAIVGHVGVMNSSLPWLQHIRDITTAFFLFSVCFVLLADITARSEQVSADLIWGAVNVYLMAGLAFAFIYADVALWQTNAFHGIDQLSYQARDIVPYIYFSYVTLSTLGYGDVTPATNLTTTIAYMEAIFGQFFLAIMVARLVGLFIADQRSKH